MQEWGKAVQIKEAPVAGGARGASSSTLKRAVAMLMSAQIETTPARCGGASGASIGAGPALPAGAQCLRETRRCKLGHRLAIKKNLRPAAFPMPAM
jgi:hypothetical protein